MGHTYMIKPEFRERNVPADSLNVPAECYWTIRKLLKLRLVGQPLTKYKMDDCDETWIDNWNTIGPNVQDF